MEKYLVDFDGVILDSQDRFEDDMKDNIDFNDWMDYLNSIDWYSFIRECNEIDESIDTLKKLEELKKLKAIITSIHSFDEGKQKEIYLREKGIYVPILYVLPKQEKSKVFIPTKEDILVDDKIRKCEDWILAGGDAILFDSNTYDTFSVNNVVKRKIKTLKNLL